MSNFVDECNINVEGGSGGAGCVSFRREAHVSKGGPDGGDGGNGGTIWLVADHNSASLLAFRDHPHRKAKSGKHGSGNKKHGSSADDVEVKVPEGTIIYDFDGNQLADLTHHGDRFLAAAGGIGGKGNAKFLSNNRRAPAFAEQGEEGEERWLRLELKLVADVALVGFPNVGKSTLISRISAAKPKIANYPFTTLEPNLGVVRIDDDNDEFEMVVADIPGLIEGAAEGKGLGHQFLRHVERARVLLIMLDLAPWDQVSAADQEKALLRELEAYQPDLLDRPRIVVGSKADMVEDDPDFNGLQISSITGAGLPQLLGLMADAVKQVRAEQAEIDDTEIVIHRPVAETISVERTAEDQYVVHGRAALRAVRLSDLTEPGALEHAQNRLDSLGVNKALRAAGAREGDLVHIGDLSFEYEEDG
ncbi:MAG: GTPase ObgE [Acidimicrobiia bacterium]|nr:GTPase ObgE [Acidimicrobiia bacterium]